MSFKVERVYYNIIELESLESKVELLILGYTTISVLNEYQPYMATTTYHISEYESFHFIHL